MAKKPPVRAKRTAKGQKPRWICNLVPSGDTHRDWKFEDAIAGDALTAAAALPPSTDLRTAWWKVGNQESTGSCVGWASTDGVMRFHLVKAGKIAKNVRLSPHYTWMASKETDEYVTRPETFIEEAGTSLKAAMEICRKYGVALESDLPFHVNTTMFGGKENSFYTGCVLRRAAAYFNMFRNFSQWRTWLASNGPILVGLNVDATWDQASSTRGKLDTFQPDTVRGGHAVCLVGYRKDGRFIVRNSWDTTWGDAGFGYAS
jgi:C1A family cysteine protease